MQYYIAMRTTKEVKVLFVVYTILASLALSYLINQVEHEEPVNAITERALK